MIVLGIDPGTKRIGYGVIKKSPANKFEFLDAGLLKISAKNEGDEKCKHLEEAKIALAALIKKFKPEVLAIEKLYFARNQKTAISVAETRGALMLTALERGLKVEEYSPNEIKAGVTGYGFADKRAVLKMVKLILNKPDLDIVDDASDALAAAIMSAGNTRS
jgi:crossover junction endodeoxyribonuclease RuvC